MHIFLSLPPNQTINQSLKQINSNIYWDQAKNKFYKLAFMPQATIFKNQDVAKRQVCTLTKYDQSFLAISFIWKQKQGKINELPIYLDKNLIQKFSTIQENKFKINEQSIIKFCQTKAKKLARCISQHSFDATMIKMVGGGNSSDQITTATIEVLKNQFPDPIIGSTILSKIHPDNRKKQFIQDQYKEQPKQAVTKSKKSKSSLQKDPQHIQSTHKFNLNMFMKKKE